MMEYYGFDSGAGGNRRTICRNNATLGGPGC